MRTQAFLVKDKGGWRVPRIGERCCRRPALAATLRAIAEEGVAGMYAADKVASMVTELNDAGGTFLEEDFHEVTCLIVRWVVVAYSVSLMVAVATFKPVEGAELGPYVPATCVGYPATLAFIGEISVSKVCLVPSLSVPRRPTATRQPVARHCQMAFSGRLGCRLSRISPSPSRRTCGA